jgi:hypothetical protein
MNTIGFSIVIGRLDETALVRNLQSMQDAGCGAFELNIAGGLVPDFSPGLLDLLRSFDYRSIHLPDLSSARQDGVTIGAYLNMAGQLDAHSLTIHPHTVKDWSLPATTFGSRLAIENMDWRKPFGRYPDELEQVFRKAPASKWTFDVNHIYSIDPTMALGEEFYRRFGDRLAHYHLSGFAGEALPHTTLLNTRQGQMMAAIYDNKPIIIESFDEQGIAGFQAELSYIQSRLQLQPQA